MPSQDAEWHDTFKPSFSNNAIFTYAVPGSAPQPTGDLVPGLQGFVGERYDVRFSHFVPPEDPNDPRPALRTQNNETEIETSGAFPFALTSNHIAFSSLLEPDQPLVPSNDRIEQCIWRLCSILYDPLDIACSPQYLKGIPRDRLDEFENRLRLDLLKDPWAQLVAAHAQDGLKRACTLEEKAFFYLTQNGIKNACETLIAAKDFKLAALVAQLPGSQRSRDMMKEQINVWKDRNDWSEMSDPIRALYSVIAGETCVVQGKAGAAEDRVNEVSFSKRFGLSWQQGFALRLFYGGHESIQDVVAEYTSDLNEGRETKRPVTRWANGKETDDVLFELLSLTTEHQPSTVFDPLTVSGSALNSRLAWQLNMLLNVRDVCSSPQQQLDQLTYDFAMELENGGNFSASVLILLHLSEPETRQRAVTDVLNRNADRISTPGATPIDSFGDLTQSLNIPAPLVWSAKALDAKTRHNPALEIEWRLKSGDVDAAHEILCSTLGPQAVIEQDYQVLSNALQLFPRRLPEGWQCGGQVYLDFVRLVNGRIRHRLSPEDEAAMKRLRRGLAEMDEETNVFSQVERVALFEMGKVLDDVVREHHGKDKRVDGMEDVGGPSLGSQMLARYQQAMGVGA